MRNLVLTGFMGTGKSTVGCLLAERHGLQFVDTDDQIERQAGKSIAQIFAEDGECAFREMETVAVRAALGGRHRVIAAGGGALLSGANRALLGSEDIVLCLTCDANELERRLDSPSGRPLLNDLSAGTVGRLLEERRDGYARFRQIDTTARTAEEVAVQVTAVSELRRVATLDVERTRVSCIVFEAGIATHLENARDVMPSMTQALVVGDANVEAAGISGSIVESLRVFVPDVHSVVLPAGEVTKSTVWLEKLYQACQRWRLERESVIVAVGGGVVCDLAGLVAATYLRGLPLVLVPTSLLAQVDASIGGKVGIDFGRVKNVVGAFYPADAVLVDPKTLRTLPPGRLAEGLAEIVKIGVVCSETLFRQLEDLDGAGSILRCTQVIREAIHQKVRIVQRDPFENGERAMLNFGHTIAHGVEAASGYGLAHGEAVSIGVVAETWLAERLGVCERGPLERISVLLDRFGLPLHVSALDEDVVMAHMSQDKKRRGGSLRFALPVRIGEGRVVDITEIDARSAVRFALRAAA
ncbi:MAG: 3-dehydroquinate synthase [Chloroflexota bacterium]